MSSLLRVTENLNELTSLLLEVSLIELGRMKMNKQNVNLSRYLTELTVPIQALAKEKNVAFRQSIPPSLPDAWLDPRLTRMTLENLLMNAVKYTSVGGHVDFSASICNGQLTCRIVDDGRGIPAKDQPHVFEKLFRASNVLEIEGNGFGLYVAKGACEQQGGRLTYQARRGEALSSWSSFQSRRYARLISPNHHFL